MTVSHKPYIIFDIKKAKGNPFDPGLSIYHLTCVLKTYLEKADKGRELLNKLGHGEHMGELNKQYEELGDVFSAMIPVTGENLEINKYQVGGEIMIAYYPTTVWATFHAEGQPDNNDEYVKEEKE